MLGRSAWHAENNNKIREEKKMTDAWCCPAIYNKMFPFVYSKHRGAQTIVKNNRVEHETYNRSIIEKWVFLFLFLFIVRCAEQTEPAYNQF